MRLCLRRRNVRYNTEKSYMAWLRRFQAFLYPRSAMEAQQADAVAFLTHLAENEQIASSTQDQCFSTLVFFFRHVLDYEEVVLEGAVRGGRDQAPAVLESRRTVLERSPPYSGSRRTMSKHSHPCCWMHIPQMLYDSAAEGVCSALLTGSGTAALTAFRTPRLTIHLISSRMA